MNTTATYHIEEMINHIRRNPNVARIIHHYLTQAPIETSTPRTPERILDSSDSDRSHIHKQQRILSNEKSRANEQGNSQQTIQEEQQQSIPFE